MRRLPHKNAAEVISLFNASLIFKNILSFFRPIAHFKFGKKNATLDGKLAHVLWQSSYSSCNLKIEFLLLVDIMSQGVAMFDLSKVKYRLNRTRINEFFEGLREELASTGGISKTLVAQLDEQVTTLAAFCTLEWNGGGPALYRARKNEPDPKSKKITAEAITKKFTTEEMGLPPAEKVVPGRANERGVAMLYLADTALTAISEVRPEVGEFVTVGSFTVREGAKLKLLDLTGSFRIPDAKFDSKFLFAFHRFPDAMRLLPDLSSAFSSPIHPGDDEQAKYLAYSHFVKKIVEKGYDGIKYRSAVSEGGVNFAFVDSKYFKCSATELHYIKGVSVHTEPINFTPLEMDAIKNFKSPSV